MYTIILWLYITGIVTLDIVNIKQVICKIFYMAYQGAITCTRFSKCLNVAKDVRNKRMDSLLEGFDNSLSLHVQSYFSCPFMVMLRLPTLVLSFPNLLDVVYLLYLLLQTHRGQTMHQLLGYRHVLVDLLRLDLCFLPSPPAFCVST